MGQNKCIDTYDFCVIRGDSFELDIALTDAWVEVDLSPVSYQANLVFREYQDDSLPPILTLSSPTITDPAALNGDPHIKYQFNATPDQTQALPAWDIVAYCELEFIGASIGAAPRRRLFNSTVSISD